MSWQSERIRPGVTLDWGSAVGSHFSGARVRDPGTQEPPEGALVRGDVGAVVVVGDDDWVAGVVGPGVVV
ncbi:hypothetical protein NBRGN_044_00050 [Nocardia brasiliensis NBRC 14402]|nr:hypothetical protein NBRGN_044_00050 [Nocardia brasiliensis NBRC 14402]